MAPKLGSTNSVNGWDDSDTSQEPTSSIHGVDQDPFWMQIPLAINCVYLLCTIGLLVAAWRLKRDRVKCESQTFYYLFFGMFFIGIATIFTIISESLFLAHAYVGVSYQVIRGIYAFFYYPANAALVAAVFSVFHDHIIQNFASSMYSAKMRMLIYLDYIIVAVMFILAAVLISFNFQHSTGVMDFYDGKNPNYGVDRLSSHWDRTATAYSSLVLAIGLYFLGYSIYLIRDANKLDAASIEIIAILSIVSQAIIVHGLYGVIVYALLFSGVLSVFQAWVWNGLAKTCVDSVTLTWVFAGMVCILRRQARLADAATEADSLRRQPGIQDLEEGTFKNLRLV